MFTLYLLGSHTVFLYVSLIKYIFFYISYVLSDFLYFFPQSIIYYAVRSPRLEHWLENPSIRQALELTKDDSYVDLDPTFNTHVDDDYDHRMSGISRQSFCNMYLNWIQHCASRQDRVWHWYFWQPTWHPFLLSCITVTSLFFHY